jgi:hypothetical protein
LAKFRDGSRGFASGVTKLRELPRQRPVCEIDWELERRGGDI